MDTNEQEVVTSLVILCEAGNAFEYGTGILLASFTNLCARKNGSGLSHLNYIEGVVGLSV